MSRKFRFFKDKIHKASLPSSAHPGMQPDVELEELQIQLAEHEHLLNEMNCNSKKLLQSLNELLEFKMVLQKAGDFLVTSKGHAITERELDENVYTNNDYLDPASLLDQEMQPGPSNQSGLRYISGIISKLKILRFERILFWATRGNMLFNQSTADDPIMDPISTEMHYFSIIFFISHQCQLIYFWLRIIGESRVTVEFDFMAITLFSLRKQYL